ncbi:MAG TPA: carbon-nitrogen hydrolase family protein [Epsilonproteobacteria bacterium]|nr:carbon-nitrogen hydrolase family protein [Campylobacterota bacterium]
MISKKRYLEIFSLQVNTLKSYNQRLERLIEAIEEQKDGSLIVASEVFLTDFDYEHLEEAATFGKEALSKLLKIVENKIVIFSLILKEENRFVNQSVVLSKNKIVHTQNKTKLFRLSNEHHHFLAGRREDIKPFEIDGVRYAILLCFELRFKDLWRQIEKAEVVVIPVKWGVARENHLVILATALAVMNQCFVVVCSDGDHQIAQVSIMINPNGEILGNRQTNGVSTTIDLQDIVKIRRYISMEEG